MTQDEQSYYSSRSKRQSEAIAGWCFVIWVVALAGFGVVKFLGWIFS
ncbi:MAG: hypothetical protein NUV75_02135 [Gallionella sp.]|nr:hypothetical protein [Gallionella sp.]